MSSRLWKMIHLCHLLRGEDVDLLWEHADVQSKLAYDVGYKNNASLKSSIHASAKKGICLHAHGTSLFSWKDEFLLREGGYRLGMWVGRLDYPEELLIKINELRNERVSNAFMNLILRNLRIEIARSLFIKRYRLTRSNDHASTYAYWERIKDDQEKVFIFSMIFDCLHELNAIVDIGNNKNGILGKVWEVDLKNFQTFMWLLKSPMSLYLA